MIIRLADLTAENYVDEIIRIQKKIIAGNENDDVELTVVFDETNKEFYKIINAIIGRLNRHLSADKTTGFDTTHIERITKLRLEKFPAKYINKILEFFGHSYYQDVEDLVLTVDQPLEFNTGLIKSLHMSVLGRITISAADSALAENIEKQFKKFSRLFHNLNMKIYVNNREQALGGEDSGSDEEIEEKPAPAVPNPELAKNIINKYLAFRKMIKESNSSLSFSDFEIESKIEQVFYLYGRTAKAAVSEAEKKAAIGEILALIKKIRESITPNGSCIYLFKVQHFLHSNHGTSVSVATLKDALAFYNEFLTQSIFPGAQGLQKGLMTLNNILKIERDGGYIPFCDSFREFDQALENLTETDVLGHPNIRPFIDSKKLSIKEITLLGNRFKEISNVKNLNFSDLLELVDEVCTTFGTAISQIILQTLLSNKELNFIYMPYILNICLQLSYTAKSSETETPENTELNDLLKLLSSSKVDETNWTAIKDKIETILQSSLLKRFPEKPLDVLFKEFTTPTSTLEVPLSVAEATIIFEKYELVNRHAVQLAKLSDHDLKLELESHSLPISDSSDAYYRVLAIIRDQVRRKFKIFPYNLQMINVLAILNAPKRLAQINTGEGKSIIIAMLAATRALQNKKVDIITTSKDLALRDSKKFQPFFKFCNLTAGHNTNEHRNERDYRPQIIYGTLADFQFAYLFEQLGQFNRQDRGFETVIIDEADHMTLEAQGTPAYISLPSKKYSSELYEKIWIFAMAQDTHLTPRNLHDYLSEEIGEEYSYKKISQWINSIKIAKKNQQYKDYIIRNDEIVIVSYQHTGQLLESSRWMGGVHAFLEAEHDLTIHPEDFCAAQVSSLEYFNLYINIYGLTGTLGNREELSDCYKVSCYDSPPYFPSMKKPGEDIVAETAAEQDAIILQDMQEQQRLGTPSLILSETIAETHHFSNLLKSHGLKCDLYNGIQDKSAETVLASGGNPKKIIVATNTAGRGADINTTPKAEINGGLNYIGTSPPYNRRVEIQNFGRTGRQGKGGTYRYVFYKEQLRSFFVNIPMPPTSKEIIAKWKELREQRSIEVSQLRGKEKHFFHLEFIAQKILFCLPGRNKSSLINAWIESYDQLNKEGANLRANKDFSREEYNKLVYLVAKHINDFYERNDLGQLHIAGYGKNALQFALLQDDIHLTAILAHAQPELLKINDTLIDPRDFTQNEKLISIIELAIQRMEANKAKIKKFIEAEELQKKLEEHLLTHEAEDEEEENDDYYDDDYDDDIDYKSEEEEEEFKAEEINAASIPPATVPTPAQLLVRSLPFIRSQPLEVDELGFVHDPEKSDEKTPANAPR